MKLFTLALLLVAQNSVEVDGKGVKLKSGDSSLTVTTEGLEEMAGTNLNGEHSKVHKRCEGKQPITIAGDYNQVALEGECANVTVSGDYNTVTIARALDLTISGDYNQVTVIEAGRANLSGDVNTLKWKRGLDAKKTPRITKPGDNNTVVHEKS